MVDRDDKLVDVECVVRIRREKAIGVADGTMEGKGRHEQERIFWLPLSLVEVHEKDGIVVMPEWLAIDKGLV
jgi:hypothetical protein